MPPIPALLLPPLMSVRQPQHQGGRLHNAIKYVRLVCWSKRELTSWQYYTVQSGDYCGKLESAFGITMPQLQLWNPDLKNDCSNLQLGNSYCVQGGQAAASVGAVAQTATTSASIRNA